MILRTDMTLAGVATCRHEFTDAKIMVAVYAKSFTLNAIGQRRIAAEVAQRQAQKG